MTRFSAFFLLFATPVFAEEPAPAPTPVTPKPNPLGETPSTPPKAVDDTEQPKPPAPLPDPPKPSGSIAIECPGIGWHAAPCPPAK